MSVAGVTIRCDARGCDKSLYHDVSMVPYTRQDHSQDGWVTINGLDYCLDHNKVAQQEPNPGTEGGK